MSKTMNKKWPTYILLALILSTLTGITSAQITIRYGNDELQFGELSMPTMPEGKGPYPVVVFIHGGCWKSSASVMNSYRAMANEIADTGIAAWNIQYRGATSPGGGWPGTWLDIANGFDMLKSLATEYQLDLDKIVAVGHSSGGHFAAWLAIRSQLPATSEIASYSGLNPAAVVLADSYINPEVIDSRGVDGSYYCGEPLLTKLVGGPLETNENHLKQISPLKWLPWKIHQEYVVSTFRYPVS